ncbi:nitroreductase family protein [Nakamurella leprariae]|uniref:Nitroreductase family protein n=1 Tax=Nakamurella leprariae TaxID=2803911 RepID=A0A938Y625_9ACTN|nr:nitroreductase family protein [Nakamurella leprariae]MBM9466711.1 nitroreductase family protein [Nakamurella leprariae]
MTDTPDQHLLDALRTTPARRYLSDRPIPDEILWDILDTATRGPSGGNRQSWGWVVVTDPETKQTIAPWYLEGWERAYGVRREELSTATAPVDQGLSPASFRATEHLARHLAEAPVWVFPVLRNAVGSTDPRLGASIYGAVQQLILAARAYGIGSALTSFHVGHEDEVRALLHLPEDATTMALVPLGYPARGRWAEPRRLPVEQVAHWGRWEAHRRRPSRA